MGDEVLSVMPAPGAGSSRGRWLIALGVAGAAIGLTIVAILVLGGRQTPEGLGYVPAQSAVVGELRLDLPGDQLQKVGNLLSHFPGFADQSTLAQKLDEAGDRLVESLSNGTVSYTADLKPWISGPAYLGLPSLDMDPDTNALRSVLLVATTNGAAGCAELFSGRATSRETYRGLEIAVLTDGPGACVVDGRYVLAGDLGSVKAGLDAHADGTGMDRDERYQAARAALDGEQLATLYASGEAVAGLAVTGAIPKLPDWSIVGIRAEDDALVLDSVSAPLPSPSATPSLASLAAAHPSELTRHVPDTAIAYAEVQGAGTSIVNALTLLRSEPALAEPLTELDQVLTGFGGVEKLLGWVDDAGVVVINDGFDMIGDLAAGVLLLAPDEATAAARVETYRSLLALAALGGVVELETTTVGEIEVTTVTVAQAAGLPVGQPLQVRFAVTGRLVVIGTSEAVIGALLGTDGEGSLARSDEFTRAIARGLANPRTALYVNLENAISFGEHFMPADEAAAFTANVRPYLEPIKAVHLTATDGPDGTRARIVMTVSQPRQP